MSAESDLKELHVQAYTAYQQGRPTFVARFKAGSWGMGTGPVGGWMDSLDAVEAAGWALDQWVVCAEPGGAFSAFPLFRRRQGQPPTQRPNPHEVQPAPTGPQDRL